MSVAVVAGLAGALLVAACVQAITGFGFALLSMPLLTLVIDAKDAVALSTLVGAVSTGALFVRTRHAVRWPLVWPLLAGALAGMPLGLFVLLVVDARTLQLGVAVTVLVFVVVLARGWRFDGQGRAVDLAAGFVSGVLNTSVSTNGPPIVLALQARGLPPDEFRGTMSAFIAACSVVSNVLFATSGRYDSSVLGCALVGPPALLAGNVLGHRLGRRLPAQSFRPMVLGLLVLAAVVAGLSALAG